MQQIDNYENNIIQISCNKLLFMGVFSVRVRKVLLVFDYKHFLLRVADVDNEFFELYGGLQAHHEEKRQQHLIDSAVSLQSKTASSNSISATAMNDPSSASLASNAPTNNETTPPPLDSIAGIEPVEMRISEDEVIS